MWTNYRNSWIIKLTLLWELFCHLYNFSNLYSDVHRQRLKKLYHINISFLCSMIVSQRLCHLLWFHEYVLSYILMWFNQLHAYVHKQQQQKSTINDIDYNHSQSNLITLTFHTKNSHKPHKYKRNFSQIQTNSQTFTHINSQSQSPNTPNISLTLIKQRSSWHNHIYFSIPKIYRTTFRRKLLMFF